MTRAHRIELYAPPICGLLVALGWFAVDKAAGWIRSR